MRVVGDVLSNEEFETLIRAMVAAREKEGIEGRGYIALRNRVLRSHLRYAHKLAHTWRRFCMKMSHEDRFQTIVLGLIHACDLYQCDRGANYRTYARFWAKAAIQRASFNTERLIRLPVFVAEVVDRIAKMGGDPDEISRRLKISELRVARALGAPEDASLVLDAPVRNPRQNQGVPFALKDAMASDDPNPEDLVAAREERAQLRRLMYRALDKNEMAAIRARLEGDTLQQAGARRGVSRERARQLEASAIEKMSAQVRREERFGCGRGR